MSAPVIISVGSGSLSTGSIVQDGYRLNNSLWATTVYSPTSPI